MIEISEDTVKEGIKVYQKYHTEDSVSKLYQPDLVSSCRWFSWGRTSLSEGKSHGLFKHSRTNTGKQYIEFLPLHF